MTTVNSAFFTGFDTTPHSITQKALTNSFSLEEKERRETAQLNKDFFYGKQEQALSLINEDVDPVVINYMNPIIDKRTSLLYRGKLERKYTGPRASVNFLEAVYEENNIDELLHHADILAELTGSALVHPLYDESLGTKTLLRIYDGSQFAVIGSDGDPRQPDAISLIRMFDRLVDGPNLDNDANPQVQVERVLLQQIWTTESVVTYEGNTVIESGENPYGFLPFANFKGEEVHDQYLGYPTADGIRKSNAQINQHLTLLGYTIKMQAGTPIALSGYDTGQPTIISPGHAINLPAGAEAKVLQLNPKIRETLETLKHIEDQLYATSSVPRITVEGNNDGGNTHISATQLKVRWYPLMEVFRDKANRFERYEKHLANTILAVNNMPLIDDIEIDWHEDDILPLAEEDEVVSAEE